MSIGCRRRSWIWPLTLHMQLMQSPLILKPGEIERASRLLSQIQILNAVNTRQLQSKTIFRGEMVDSFNKLKYKIPSDGLNSRPIAWKTRIVKVGCFIHIILHQNMYVRQCCNRVRLESHTRTLPVTRAVFCDSFPLKFVHDSTDSTRLEP